MNAIKEKKSEQLRNFKFVESADAKLVQLSNRTGKDMTVILEDLILGRRQFSPEIEEFIESECLRTRRPREQVIEACIYAATREAHAEQESLALNDKPKSVDAIVAWFIRCQLPWCG